jgi:acyl-CoA thioester hydrolase
MPRTKLTLPEHFSFTTEIPVRITDLNYGGHVGNDSILSLIHEARVRFLHHHGYHELDMAGVGLIMADVTIEFKSELFYGDTLRASIAAAEFSRVGFDLYYKLEKALTSVLSDEPSPATQKWVPVSNARTGMVCYDYKLKKIAAVPKEVCNKLLS